jgi:hypothetical protein
MFDGRAARIVDPTNLFRPITNLLHEEVLYFAEVALFGTLFIKFVADETDSLY